MTIFVIFEFLSSQLIKSINQVPIQETIILVASFVIGLN